MVLVFTMDVDVAARTYESVVHVVIFIDTLDSKAGGPQQSVLDLCRALPHLAVRLTIVTFERADFPFTEASNLHIVEMADSRRPGDLISGSGRRRLAEILSRADLLHLHGIWGLYNAQAARLARQLAKPYVVTAHGMLDHWSMKQRALKKRIYLAMIGRRYLEHATCVLATAIGEKRQISEQFPTIRTEILPYVFDEMPFKHRAARHRAGAEKILGLAPTDRRRILFLSRLHYKKGLHTLIDSLAILKRRGNAPQLIIAGAGNEAYESLIREQIRDNNLEDDVIFLGHVTGEKKFAAFEACDLLTIPTSQENFGIVFVEAMASGLPVLTTQGTDIWNELQSAGAHVADGAPEPFAAAIEAALAEGAALAQRGLDGREWVMDNLNRARVATRYRDFYWDVAQRQPDLLYAAPMLLQRSESDATSPSAK